MKELEKRQNFISCNKKIAISSEGEYFSVGEIVEHQDIKAGEAKILRFESVHDENEITVHTTKGFAHLDFLIKKEE